MNQMRLAIRRVLSLFQRTRLDGELENEIETHLEFATAEYAARGMTPQAARQAALRDFGGIARTKEIYRDARGMPMLEAIVRDVTYALRSLRKSPAFTSVAVATLALGIGANTAMFSIVDGVLLRPVPFPEADRLVALYGTSKSSSKGAISYPNLLDWQRQSRTFEGIAGWRLDQFTYTGTAPPELLTGGMVSANYFSLLRVPPVLGRTFETDEDRLGAPPVIVIGESAWRRLFSADPGIVGRNITLDGLSRTIVGVVPDRAGVLGVIDRQLYSDVFLPIGQYDDPLFLQRGVNNGTLGIGRLTSNVTSAQARAEMDGIAANLAAAYPEANGGRGINVVPLREDLVGGLQATIWPLAGAVGFVLLIACANVANLVLARSQSRAQEFALRASLGASHGRIIRQLLSESAVLSVAGATVGIALAAIGTRVALRVLPTALPGLAKVGMNVRVLAFAFSAAATTGVLFGLVPALRAARQNLQANLTHRERGGGTSRRRTQDVLIVVQIALTLVLLVGAGLMTRSLARLWSVSPGFDAQNVLTFRTGLSIENASSGEKVRASWTTINDRLSVLPGVQAASVEFGALPFTGGTSLGFWPDGEPRPARGEARNTMFYAVGPDYFKVMQIPLLRGREFTRLDAVASAHVAIIDDEFARAVFPDEDPIGRRIHFTGFDQIVEVAGVVGHVKHWGLDADTTATIRSQLYLPYMQVPDSLAMLASKSLTGVVRSELPAAEVIRSIRAALEAFDRGQAVHSARDMDELIASSLAGRRFLLIVLGVFAGTALVLSIVGVYGLVSYLVGQRTREFGVRIALGAATGTILRSVLLESGRLALVGVVLGLTTSLGLTRFVAGQLYGVTAADPATFVLVSIVFSAIVILASYVPARRATKIEPLTALRGD